MLAYNTHGLRKEHLPVLAAFPSVRGVKMGTETVGSEELLSHMALVHPDT